MTLRFSNLECPFVCVNTKADILGAVSQATVYIWHVNVVYPSLTFNLYIKGLADSSCELFRKTSVIYWKYCIVLYIQANAAVDF